MVEHNATATAERPPYGLRKSIEAVKDGVSILDYLQAHGVEVKRNRARCVIHHGDNPQTFSVNPAKQLFHCFKCGAGGDVVTLCQLVEGGEPWEAMFTLAQRFGVELPERPPQWAPWQDEKAKRRRMVRDALADGYQRRWFRVYGGYLEEISNPEEYQREAERFFASLRPVAVHCARYRMNGGSEHE